MALVRWEPVRELTSLQNEMNRLFTTFFDTPTTNGETARPPLDPGHGPRRDRRSLRPQGRPPGLTEGEVSLEVEDNVLTVSGERKAEHEDKREGYVARRALLRRVPPLADAPRGHRRRGGHRAASTRASSRSASRSPRSASRAGSPSRWAIARRPSRATSPRSHHGRPATSLRARARRGPAVVLAPGLARLRLGLDLSVDLGVDQRLGPPPPRAQHEPQRDAGRARRARRRRARRGG